MSENKNKTGNKFYVFEVYVTNKHWVTIEAGSEEEAKERFNDLDVKFTDETLIDGDLDYEIGWSYDEGSQLYESEKDTLKTSKEGWRYLC